MKARFNVTFETITHESAEQGDFADSGLVASQVSLKEAVSYLGDFADSADSYPASRNSPPRWFTNTTYQENYSTGEVESRSLHIPPSITPSSRLRLARYFGLEVR